MDDLLSEKEQIDQIRAWWKEYGGYVIGGVVLGTGLLFGVNYFQNTKLQSQLDASVAYEELVLHIADGKIDEAEFVASNINSNHAKTTYAGQAGLAMARMYMDANRDQDAANELLAVIAGNAGEEVKHVARLRLSRIYLYQNKAQEVVDMLEPQDTAAFTAAYGEVLGDAYAVLDRVQDAQNAYEKVLTDPLFQGTVDQQLVQWKALDLPEVPAEAATLDDVPEQDTDAEIEAAE